MSNPAVFELNNIKIGDESFLIEDNIGESIHFHLGHVRFDMTIKEFEDIAKKLLGILNDQIHIEDFDLLSQNEYFLERIARYLPYIKKVEDIQVKVSDLKYRYEDTGGDIREEYLTNTPFYLYYKGDRKIIKDYIIKTEIWQSKEEVMEQIKKIRNDLIYVDENDFVLDGCKSICSELALNKDCPLEIKVRKIIMSEGHHLKFILHREKKKW